MFNILSGSSYFCSLGPAWVFCQSIVKKTVTYLHDDTVDEHGHLHVDRQ